MRADKWIRDEIRIIAPGIYLGKVYWDKKRLIDFALDFQKLKNIDKLSESEVPIRSEPINRTMAVSSRIVMIRG
jgi:hypothetical protein